MLQGAPLRSALSIALTMEACIGGIGVLVTLNLSKRAKLLPKAWSPRLLRQRLCEPTQVLRMTGGVETPKIVF